MLNILHPKLIGFSIRYTAYEALHRYTAYQAALCKQNCGFQIWDSDAILWIYWIYCNFNFHVIHIKQDNYNVLFYFFSLFLLPSPDLSITWVVSTQADISERSRSSWSHLYYPAQVPVFSVERIQAKTSVVLLTSSA